MLQRCFHYYESGTATQAKGGGMSPEWSQDTTEYLKSGLVGDQRAVQP